MGAILQSLGRTVAAGVVLLVILVLLVSALAGGPTYDHAWGAFFMRYLHVLSGVMWIGLLWYFNFVQIPSMPKIPDEQKPAIGIGMWLGLIMAFNVWFIIWPNQKKALGIVTVTPEEKAKAARLAMLTSRANTLLSIPMLFCMVAQQNGGL
ncbi:MAG: urate hydroxylase PuuD [Burkholderiales bacterium]